MRKHLFVSRAAVRQAILLEIAPNHYRGAERKIAEMADQSAPFTHGRVNRRYGDVGLMLQDNTVTRVISLKPQVVKGRRKASAQCPTCRGARKIPVPRLEKGDPAFIPCPDCAIPQK